MTGNRALQRVLAALASVPLALAAVAPADATPLPTSRFDSYLSTEVNEEQTAATVADLNGDGVPDLATAGSWLAGGRLRIFYGLGNGTFGTPEMHDVLNGSRSVAAGDL